MDPQDTGRRTSQIEPIEINLSQEGLYMFALAATAFLLLARFIMYFEIIGEDLQMDAYQHFTFWAAISTAIAYGLASTQNKDMSTLAVATIILLLTGAFAILGL